MRIANQLTKLTKFRTQNCLQHGKLKLTNLKLKTLFRQDDRIGAKRRKTANGSPKGERSESICRNLKLTDLKLKTLLDRIYRRLQDKQKGFGQN